MYKLKVIRQTKKYDEDFRCDIRVERVRIIHPISWILFIVYIAHGFATEGIIPTIKDIPEVFCII